MLADGYGVILDAGVLELARLTRCGLAACFVRTLVATATDLQGLYAVGTLQATLALAHRHATADPSLRPRRAAC